MKDYLVVSPKYKTVKEAAEWIDLLHWSHTFEDTNTSFEIKKQKKDNDIYFFVVKVITK